MWEAHDALAQTYSGLNQPEKEINHYRKAIKILIASTKVPPEVDFQPYISKQQAFVDLVFAKRSSFKFTFPFSEIFGKPCLCF